MRSDDDGNEQRRRDTHMSAPAPDGGTPPLVKHIEAHETRMQELRDIASSLLPHDPRRVHDVVFRRFHLRSDLEAERASRQRGLPWGSVPRPSEMLGLSKRALSKDDLAYSERCMRDYLRWLARSLRALHQQGRESALHRLVTLADAHDSHGLPLYPGDVLDSSVTASYFGILSFSHQSIYLGGGFIAHAAPTRRSTQRYKSGVVASAKACFRERELSSILSVARLVDVEPRGMLTSRTAAVADGRMHAGEDASGGVGVGVVPTCAHERALRIGTALQCTGIYGYNIGTLNCQCFINAVCGAGWVSQGVRSTARMVVVLAFAALVLGALAFVLVGAMHSPAEAGASYRR